MSEQLTPSEDVSQRRTVAWINALEVHSKTPILRRPVSRLEYVEDPEGKLTTTAIDVEDISELADPDLRYALRFAAAARSAGWFARSTGRYAMHGVMVVATDEGRDSKLLRAHYSGSINNGLDTFVQNLHRHQPAPEIPGMSTVTVAGEDGSPDTRFWVQKRESE